MSWQGTVLQVQITDRAAGRVTAVPEVIARPGKGLEGDRYFKKIGTFSGKIGPDREVTLIGIEALEALEAERGIALAPEESRRNLVTRGVPLAELVGRELLVGQVRLRGLRACEPCAHLSELTGKPLLRGLMGRGGLRAQILVGGTIRPGDVVRPAPTLDPSAVTPAAGAQESDVSTAESKTIRVNALIRAKKGQEAACRDMLRGLVGPTRREDGCLRYELLEDPQDATAFHFEEEWRDASSLERHLASAHVAAAFARAAELLAGAPEIKRLRRLA